MNLSLTGALNTRKAYDAIIKAEYDIYFIDYYLGARTGLDLMKDVFPKAGDQPLILLTGMGNQQIDREAMEAGAFDYLVKLELNTEKLERCIRYSLQRAAALKILSSNERKFRGIFEESKDAVFLTDQNLVFQDVNDITIDMLGYSRDELMHLSLYHFLVNQELADGIKERLVEEGNVDDREIELASKDGEKISCIWSLSVERDAESNLYVQGIIHDISNLKKAENVTLQAEKLGAANRLVRALAHEVRTPLNNINLAVDQLTQEQGSGTDSVYLDIIMRNSKRINDLIS